MDWLRDSSHSVEWSGCVTTCTLCPRSCASVVTLLCGVLAPVAVTQLHGVVAQMQSLPSSKWLHKCSLSCLWSDCTNAVTPFYGMVVYMLSLLYTESLHNCSLSSLWSRCTFTVIECLHEHIHSSLEWSHMRSHWFHWNECIFIFNHPREVDECIHLVSIPECVICVRSFTSAEWTLAWFLMHGHSCLWSKYICRVAPFCRIWALHELHSRHLHNYRRSHIHIPRSPFNFQHMC